MVYCITCANFYFHFYVATCFPGQTRLADNYTTFDGTYSIINGIVEVCVDGQYVPICGRGAIASNLSDIATSACHGVQYLG